MTTVPERPKSEDSHKRAQEAYKQQIDFKGSNMYEKMLTSLGMRIVRMGGDELITTRRTIIEERPPGSLTPLKRR